MRGILVPAGATSVRLTFEPFVYSPLGYAVMALGVLLVGIEFRLTGLHETAPWDEFSYGVSDRGASVRIPWQVAVDKKGYIEDRRPNANCDPYEVTRLIVSTCCAALEKAHLDD